MEKAGKDLDLNVACEIFADRNYEDNGRLVSRDQSHALKLNVVEATQDIINMLNDKAILCYSGKRIPCPDRFYMCTWRWQECCRDC